MALGYNSWEFILFVPRRLPPNCSTCVNYVSTTFKYAHVRMWLNCTLIDKQTCSPTLTQTSNIRNNGKKSIWVLQFTYIITRNYIDNMLIWYIRFLPLAFIFICPSRLGSIKLFLHLQAVFSTLSVIHYARCPLHHYIKTHFQAFIPF